MFALICCQRTGKVWHFSKDPLRHLQLRATTHLEGWIMCLCVYKCVCMHFMRFEYTFLLVFPCIYATPCVCACARVYSVHTHTCSCFHSCECIQMSVIVSPQLTGDKSSEFYSRVANRCLCHRGGSLQSHLRAAGCQLPLVARLRRIDT